MPEIQTEEPAKTPEGVLRKSIRGGGWMTLSYVAQKAIGLASFFVLARILSPGEFGIMAIILLLPKFLESMTDTGFSAALIQKSDNINDYLNSTWTLRILKSIVIAAVIAILSDKIAGFFHIENASLAIKWSGIFIVIQSLSNAGEILIFRKMEFKKIFYRNICREVAFVATALLSAVYFQNYLVLFAANLAAYSAQTLSTYWISNYRPKLDLNFKRLWHLFNYSKWIVGQRWIVQAYNIIESISIAKLTSAYSVGLYSKAKSLSAVVPVFLSSTLGLISFPAYSRIKENKERIKEGILKSLDIIFFFSIPVVVLVFSSGGKLVEIFLGKEWLQMVPALRILTLFFVINGVNDLSISIFNALGEPRRQTVNGTVRLLVTASLIVPFTMLYGITGASISVLIGSMILLAMNINGLHKMEIFNLKSIKFPLLIPVISSAILMIILELSRPFAISLSNLNFTILVAASGMFYFGSVFIFDKIFSIGPYATIRYATRNILK